MKLDIYSSCLGAGAVLLVFVRVSCFGPSLVFNHFSQSHVFVIRASYAAASVVLISSASKGLFFFFVKKKTCRSFGQFFPSLSVGPRYEALWQTSQYTTASRRESCPVRIPRMVNLFTINITTNRPTCHPLAASLTARSRLLRYTTSSKPVAAAR